MLSDEKVITAEEARKIMEEEFEKLKKELELSIKIKILSKKIDHELDIKLKVMEETERKIIDKIRFKLYDKVTITQGIIDIFEEIEKEFNEKWFK